MARRRCCAACRLKRRRHQASVQAALRALRRSRRGNERVSRAFVNEQLAFWQHRSVISGATRHLRLRPFWPDRPLDAFNCIVVTAREDKLLGRAGRGEIFFPAEIVGWMEELRCQAVQAAAPVTSDRSPEEPVYISFQ